MAYFTWLLGVFLPPISSCHGMAFLDPIIIELTEQNSAYPSNFTDNSCLAEHWLENKANKTVFLNETRRVVQSSGKITKAEVQPSSSNGQQSMNLIIYLQFNEIPQNESRLLAAMQNNSVNHFVLTATVKQGVLPYKNESVLPSCSDLKWSQILKGTPCVQIKTSDVDTYKLLWNNNQSQNNLRCFREKNNSVFGNISKVEVHEAYGYVTDLITTNKMSENSISLLLKIQLNWWTKDVGNRLLDSIAEINTSIDNIQLESFLALPSLVHDTGTVYFTFGKIFSIAVACLVGFSILVLSCACCILGCTRSPRSFDMRVWEYVRRKAEMRYGGKM